MKIAVTSYFLYCLLILPVLCSHYLPLLNELDMKNPFIIGKNEDLRNKSMFDLMKNIMKIDQTVCLTTNITDEVLSKIF